LGGTENNDTGGEVVTVPTIKEIKSQILSYIEAADTSTPSLPTGTWDILAGALAIALYLLYKSGLQWLYKQLFTKFMDDEALDAKGLEYGLTRNKARKWKGAAIATGEDGTIIAKGKTCSHGDYAYKVKEQVEISGKTAMVLLESLKKGDAVSLSSGAVLNWSTPQTGLNKSLTVNSTTQVGEDAEKPSNFRPRLLNRQRLQTQAGTAAWWVSLALENPGISEAYAYNTAPGIVSIYMLTDDSNPENRIPGEEKLSECKAYLSDSSRRLFLANVNVPAFTELPFDIDISNLSPDTSSLRTAIEKAITKYLYARRPKQYVDEVESKSEISPAELTTLLTAAGAKTGTVLVYHDGVLIQKSLELKYYQLAVPGSISWGDTDG
jgi:uncharacterized phage protein gp47/JayE